ncbi:DUF3169 family protein [Sporosarcina cascadiensis]|uniref:DUF3169 family protein n=1 Tax=Sporosarcina cascadiensis TaxID=2660747 RepID=UPI00129A2B55|nr:DUF3169 family protein [Sporosarcina cascadiensis]
MKTIIWMLIGGAVGFFGMYAVLTADIKLEFAPVAFEMNIALLAITAVLLITAAVSIVQMKKKSKLYLTGEKEDKRDVWQYKRFSDTSLIVTAAMAVGISAIAIAIITDQPSWLMISSIIIGALTFILSITLSSIVNSLYPDRELPDVSAKDYSQKLLAVSDEGERHVMLEGLYRAFNTMNLILILTLLLLIIYSAVTGDSQLFSIFIIGMILIGTNAQYLFAIRNKT